MLWKNTFKNKFFILPPVTPVILEFYTFWKISHFLIITLMQHISNFLTALNSLDKLVKYKPLEAWLAVGKPKRSYNYDKSPICARRVVASR